MSTDAENELPRPKGRGINIGTIFSASAYAEETLQAAGNMTLSDLSHKNEFIINEGINNKASPLSRVLALC